MIHVGCARQRKYAFILFNDDNMHAVFAQQTGKHRSHWAESDHCYVGVFFQLAAPKMVTAIAAVSSIANPPAFSASAYRVIGTWRLFASPRSCAVSSAI